MAKSSPKGLGKGLGALFSETPVLETAGSGAVSTLPLQTGISPERIVTRSRWQSWRIPSRSTG